MKQFFIFSLLALTTVLWICAASALDLTDGLMYSVPTPQGRAPVIDGDLKDWDLSGAEPIYMAPATIQRFHANVALMHDDDALYVGARVSLPGRDIHNPNNPVDAFWWSDVLELRLAADPALPAPLNGGVVSDRIVHITMWKNSATGKDYVNMAFGIKPLAPVGGTKINPPGVQHVIKQHAQQYYTLEARFPWSVLNVPGGKNPFAPGQRMTAVWSPHWGGETQVAALYRQNPGSFAFNQPQTWGQVEFAPAGDLKPRHETLEQLMASIATAQPQDVGVPITIDVPDDNLKVSVNVFDEQGGVLRELMGGTAQPKGKLALRWDGRDQWGEEMPPGNYRWGAYFSPGLKAQYVGTVGRSGTPPYETADGTGGWGADHGAAIDVAADATGMYFLWHASEDGRAVVKTDFSGKVLWRKTPFVSGGFGDFSAVAANGKFVYLANRSSQPELVKLDAATGQLLKFNEASTTMPISATKAVEVPDHSSPLHGQPEAAGLAVTAKEVFASVYSQNKIQVMDAQSGAPTRELACPGPRGLALDAQGNLYAVSYVAGQTPRILKYARAVGAATPVVSGKLDAPWDVAVDARGFLHVSDGADSQQIKVFSSKGKLVRALGKAGGRTWAGAYDPMSFLMPAGVASDGRGGVLVAEASPPKVMSRWDASTGKPLQKWFGNLSYTAMTWPDPDDPLTAYYTLSGPQAFARAKVPTDGSWGAPQASWAMPQAGWEGVGTLVDRIAAASFITPADNGRKYMVSDSNPHGIALVAGDQMLPVGHAQVFYKGQKNNALDKHYIELWSDANGDHRPQPDEMTILDSVAGQPLPLISGVTGSMWMDTNGDLYLNSGNAILQVPATGFGAKGAIRWDASKAFWVIPEIVPEERLGRRGMMTSYRAGLLGVRRDSARNIYLIFNTNVNYATPEMTAQLQEGLGHTGESNAVKFAKFSPDGKLLWMAGRKATSAARPGEMYHFWNINEPIGNSYISGASEWGQIYFYTHDGFFVDALMNNPGLAPAAGPYTFGSETFGMSARYFPQRDEVWAYGSGRAFKVQGFKNGKVAGERRVSGTVALDKVYDVETAQQQAAPLQIVRVTDPRAATAWQDAPQSTLRRDDDELATVQLGYDDKFLYARVHVNDATPLQNTADSPALLFKGGDAVGLSLGAAPQHNAPQKGDVRFLAALVGGRPLLLAMKPVSGGAKKPETYRSPVGEARFEFVGEVPGGAVVFTPDEDKQGYRALLTIPRAFLEFDLEAGATLSGDIEVLLSGQGMRGLQTIGRNFLFAPRNTATTMTDDIPTEARLNPQFWGEVEVK